MKLIGGIIIFLSILSLNHDFSWSMLFWLFLGIILIAAEQVIAFLGHTMRFIHRSVTRDSK